MGVAERLPEGLQKLAQAAVKVKQFLTKPKDSRPNSTIHYMNSTITHQPFRAFFLLASGLKHLYNIYVADPTIMATGYPEPEATAFVLAMLETKFLLPFICTVKLIAAVLLVLPGREQLGVLMAFPYALGMFMWGIFMVPSHIVIMSAIFAFNAALVYANWHHYKGLLKA